MTAAAGRPRGGLWRADIVRAVLSGHSALGIAFASVIYLVCLTGTLCVFMRDFQRWEQPSAPVMRSVSDAAAGRAIAVMGARIGPDKTFYVTMPGDGMSQFILSSGDDADDQTWIADGDGRLAQPQRDPWTGFLGDLHTHLVLPESWGRFVVGLAGVALLSSLISGVLAHPRIVRDSFHLRLGGSRRLQEADLHNRLGVWALPFHVVVSLTGALLGLSTLIVGVLALLLFKGDTGKVYDLLGAPPPAADARPAPMPDVATLLARTARITPEAKPVLLTVRHWGQRDMTLGISAARPRLLAQQDSFTFDATGKLIAEKHPAGLTLGERILGSLGPLHFGWFGGLAIRLAYGFLGLALCAVTSSGIQVWLARRRDKGRPAPLWERIWTAIAWGQPLALAVTALASLSVMDDPSALGHLWAIMTALLLLLAGLWKSIAAARLAWGLRIAIGMAALVLGLMNAMIRVRTAPDGVALLIDMLLGAVAVVVIAMALRTGKKAGTSPRSN